MHRDREALIPRPLLCCQLAGTRTTEPRCEQRRVDSSTHGRLGRRARTRFRSLGRRAQRRFGRFGHSTDSCFERRADSRFGRSAHSRFGRSAVCCIRQWRRSCEPPQRKPLWWCMPKNLINFSLNTQLQIMA